ncbi:hypothetical protein HY948_04360 [Candidatus Gottesmanbacteria bacterium]|nr:hypothetical protein [Candidatus Gottesmanbacteria bacterium]
MKKAIIGVFLLLFAIVLVSTFHEEYPDEYDSIVGGLYITHGKLPYRDWFQHHQPFAYVVAAGLLPFTGQSFVKFRIAYGILLFSYHVGIYLLLRRRVRSPDIGFYLLFLLSVALASTYFWGQMLLADTLAAYLIIPGYALLVLKEYHKERFSRKDLAIVSASTFFTWFTSMTFTYVVIGLNLYAMYVFLKSDRGRYSLFGLIKIVGTIFVAPYALFLLYLIVTGSLKDYYFANIVYNQQYYIYNYPGGGTVNPIRYAAVIANNFINNYLPALWGVKDFSFSDPIQVTLALSNAALFVLLLLKKRFAFLFPFFMAILFSVARSNPQAIRETDYQSSVYILFSMFNGLFTLGALKKLLDEDVLKSSIRSIITVVFLLLSVYWFFNAAFLIMKFEQKFYPKYMGQAPLIYDYPQIAPLINKMITTDDYAWIGPFEFKELFYLKTQKLASRYHWFLKQAAVSKIKGEMVADFERSRPKVIVFKRAYSPWGGNAPEFNYFFTDFLDKNYVRLCRLNAALPDFAYEWTTGDPRNFQFATDINFDNQKKDEILLDLERQGLIKKGAKNTSLGQSCVEKE